jgi:hypothetical protein
MKFFERRRPGLDVYVATHREPAHSPVPVRARGAAFNVQGTLIFVVTVTAAMTATKAVTALRAKPMLRSTRKSATPLSSGKFSF